MTLSNLPLKTKLTMLSGLFLVGMATVGVLAITTLNAVKIGGDTYSEIRTATDIGSNYAPPSGYLITPRGPYLSNAR